MNAEILKIKVGGRTIDLPIYKDRETTKRIVRRVNQRLKEIEEGSTRIDTQEFALRATVAFAAEVEEARAHRTSDDAELLVALDQLSDSLESILEDHRDDS